MRFLPRGGPCALNFFLLVLSWLMVSLITYQLSISTLLIPLQEFKTREPSETFDYEDLILKPFNESDQNLIEEIQKEMPNLPIVYWKGNWNWRQQPMLNETCAQLPDLFALKYNNIYWQTFRTSNGTFHLFGAYLDIRKNNQLGPTVRILGMLDRNEPTISTYCQFWFDKENKPVIVRTSELRYMWLKDWGGYDQGVYQPYLISCELPRVYQNAIPQAVSLVEKPCDTASNNLRVIYNKPEQRKDFAVCVKGLTLPHVDLSVKLAEWIELLHLLGADKIFFYELEVHPNISKLLDYYQKQEIVHVTPLKLAGDQPNGPRLQSYYVKTVPHFQRLNELIPYNDCFYKHMYEYKYIVLLDTDEVIIPKKYKTWKELLDEVSSKAWKEKPIERASFLARNVYFLDDLLHQHGWFKDIPPYLHMLQHVYRTKNFTKPGSYIKAFHNTEKVLTLHNHYPLACLGNCYWYSIDTSDAQLQHYRSDCVDELKKVCQEFRNNSVMDTSVWKFKETLVERVTGVLKTLGYFSKSYEGRA